MPENDNQNDQNPGGNDQTDYKARYLELSTQITSGEYVPKKVYVGLQQTHEKEVNAHKADFDALQNAAAKVQEFEKTLPTLQSQVSEFQTKYGETEAALKAREAEAARLKLIMGEFPGLVQFEGQGLLPEAPSLDELKVKLTKFQELHGATAKQQQIERRAGESDQPSGKGQLNQNPTATSILAEAKALQAAGKNKEYYAKMQEYYQLPSA